MKSDSALISKTEIRERTRTLVREAQGGSETAFRGLHEFHYHAVNSYIARHFYRNDLDKSEDVTQAAFARAFRNLPAFRGDSEFRTWVTKIAINEARRIIARNKNDPLCHSIADITNSPLDDDEKQDIGLASSDLTDPADILQQQQATQKLQAYLEKRMADRDPVAEGLRFLWRWSNGQADYQSLADEAGIPVGTVRSRISRARQELKEKLGPHFH